MRYRLCYRRPLAGWRGALLAENAANHGPGKARRCLPSCSWPLSLPAWRLGPPAGVLASGDLARPRCRENRFRKERPKRSLRAAWSCAGAAGEVASREKYRKRPGRSRCQRAQFPKSSADISTPALPFSLLIPSGPYFALRRSGDRQLQLTFGLRKALRREPGRGLRQRLDPLSDLLRRRARAVQCRALAQSETEPAEPWPAASMRTQPARKASEERMPRRGQTSSQGSEWLCSAWRSWRASCVANRGMAAGEPSVKRLQIKVLALSCGAVFCGLDYTLCPPVGTGCFVERGDSR